MIKPTSSQVHEQARHLPVRACMLAYLAATRGGRNPASQRHIQQRLLCFAAWCEAQNIGCEEVNARIVASFVDHLEATHKARKRGADTLSRQTLGGYVQTIKSALLWASGDELVYAEYVNEKTIKRIVRPKRDEVIIETFTDTHIRQLLAACKAEENPKMVARAKMAIHLLYSTGIRASELVHLRLPDCHLEAGSAYLMIRQGKGRKDRRVPMSETTRRRLEDFILTWRVDIPPASPVITSRDGTESFTVAGLQQLLKRLARRAGISDMRVSPHNFRHTFSANALRAGMDIYTLQRVLGHSSTSITEHYIKSLGADFDLHDRAVRFMP